MVVIHSTAIVLHAVADNQIIHVQQKVVRGYLIKDLLSYGHRGCFVLDNHARFQHVIIENRVTAQAFFAYAQLYFVAQECLRITFMLYQEVCEVLAYPFLGCQRHITTTQEVENLRLLACPS